LNREFSRFHGFRDSQLSVCPRQFISHSVAGSQYLLLKTLLIEGQRQTSVNWRTQSNVVFCDREGLARILH
jgi:hypothetical protein